MLLSRMTGDTRESAAASEIVKVENCQAEHFSAVSCLEVNFRRKVRLESREGKKKGRRTRARAKSRRLRWTRANYFESHNSNLIVRCSHDSHGTWPALTSHERRRGLSFKRKKDLLSMRALDFRVFLTCFPSTKITGEFFHPSYYRINAAVNGGERA